MTSKQMLAKELGGFEAEIEIDTDGDLRIESIDREHRFYFPPAEARRIRDWLSEVLKDE